MLVLVVVLVVMVMTVTGIMATAMRIAHNLRMPGEPCCSTSATAPLAHLQPGRGVVGIMIGCRGMADELWALWDGKPARAYGGTADVVAYARDRGVPVRVIWPDGARRD